MKYVSPTVPLQFTMEMYASNIICRNPRPPKSSNYASTSVATAQVNQTLHFTTNERQHLALKQPLQVIMTKHFAYNFCLTQLPQEATHPNIDTTCPRIPPPRPLQSDSDQTYIMTQTKPTQLLRPNLHNDSDPQQIMAHK
jgi:hypothetical protein